MAEQPTNPIFDPDDALDLLNEAWAYFTPGAPEPAQDNAYEEFPAAA